MRRISVFLAIAAVLITIAVAYTYSLRRERDLSRHVEATPQIATSLDALAHNGWKYGTDDPKTNKPIVRATAQAFEASHDSGLHLVGVGLRLYDKAGGSYTFVHSEKASFDEGAGILKSEGPVSIVMKVPSDKNAENPKDIEKLLQVATSGITYETKTGKADTNQPAQFHFPQGSGSATGVSYDPNTHELHLKSAVSLDWIGNGPLANKMHIETGDLVYKEQDRKIFLTPWSKMTRLGTSVQALGSVVTLTDDGALKQIDSEHATGTDKREDKTTNFAGDHMTALYDEGTLTEMDATGHAKVMSAQETSRTTLTGNRAVLRFTVTTKMEKGQEETESNLREVMAEGKALAESDPIPHPGVALADTRLLRSEQILMEMRPDGKNVQEIHTPAKAQLEFKPNTPAGSHRIVNASRLQVVYGDDNYIQHLEAWDAVTHTDKPASAHKPGTPVSPAVTWSDKLLANFQPGGNSVSSIDQDGHFRYEEGKRKASSDKASLDEKTNRITLTTAARVADDTGSAFADQIIMDQASGDMDASGHVVSTRVPDNKQKPGTSVLDTTKTMQAKADRMTTRDDNTKIVYDGNASVWQGANRTSAQWIAIDRDAQTLDAKGHVVSELADNKNTNAVPIFTVVRAPLMSYRDDTKVAVYSGGVNLVHDRMTVVSKELKAFLTAQSSNGQGSSLDHAFADGDVTVVEDVMGGAVRKGTAEHCEYYAQDGKVILNGGKPQFADSRKGVTEGKQLTYYSNDDRMVVDGEKAHLAYTKMKKK